jgi:hypothetical protein
MLNSDGETIAYWLPFPGLVRLIISFFFLVPNFIFEMIGFTPIIRDDTYFSTLSMAFSYFFCLYFTYRIFMLSQTIEESRHCASSNTTKKIIVILSLINPYWLFFPSTAVFFESISWAVTMTVVLTYFFLKFYFTEKKIFLTIFSLLLFLSYFTRVVEIISATVLTIILIASYVLKKRCFERNLIPQVASLFLGPIFLGILNKARWDSWTTLVPIKNATATQASSIRLAAAENYGNIEFFRVPANFDYYLLPDPKSFINEFPFIQLTNMRFNYSMVSMDYAEPKLTVWLTFPVVALISLTFIFWSIKNYSKSTNVQKNLLGVFVLITVSAGLGVSSLLVAPALALRYLADWYPLFIPFCILFFARLGLKIEKEPRNRRYVLILNVLTIVAIFQTLLFFLVSKSYYRY